MTREEKIKKFLNVEGGVSLELPFLPHKTAVLLEEFNYNMQKFGHWLLEGEFKRILLEDNECVSTIKYFDSVIECDPVAFAQASVDVCTKLDTKDDKRDNEVTIAYKEIKIPKLFCLGTRPVMESCRTYLIQNSLEYKEFDVPSHWIMLDKKEEFYAFLESFMQS